MSATQQGSGGTQLPGALRRYWHPVATSDGVGDNPVHVDLLDVGIVLYRDPQGVVALEDLCIHRGTPLSLGRVTPSGTIQCGYHGWQFNAQGVCTHIPSKGSGGSIPRKARVTSFRTVERYGLVWCALEEPQVPLPSWPYGEWDKPEYRNIMLDAHHWNSSAGRVVDNFLDISHLAFVHGGVLATDDEAVMPALHIKHTDDGLYFNRREREAQTPHSQAGEMIFWEYFVTLPFTAHIKKTTEGGRETVISLLCSPTSAKRTTFFFGLGRNYETDPQHDQRFIDFHYDVSEQDRRIVEQQRPEEIPTSLREELHVRDADAVSMAYRRLLAGMGTPANQLP